MNKRMARYYRLAVIAFFPIGITAQAAPLYLSNVPLFVTTNAKPNVLVILDNSNSMDEAPNGAAVGSASPDSKSEIARKVIRRKDPSRTVNPDHPDDLPGLIDRYIGKINLGLMAYQQLPPGTAGSSSNNFIVPSFLHQSLYDVSYNPANYDPMFSGPRESTTKRYRLENPASPGDYIHYNVSLPLYAGSQFDNIFCYAPDANAFNNGEVYIDGHDNPPDGPWDFARCFRSKTGSSDALPIPPGPTPPPHNGFTNWWTYPFITGTITASELALGYSDLVDWYPPYGVYGVYFYPTDSDLAQGIVDFGKLTAMIYTSRTWLANASPGRGYLHVPIKELDEAHAENLDKKLAPSQFLLNRPVDPEYPIQNAGLTPLEGTLLTARDYFSGHLSAVDEGGPQPAPPNSCGKNFIALMTDGLPSTDKNGNPVSDPVAAISEVADAAAQLLSDGIETYVVGFALPYGVSSDTLNTIAAAGGTGSAFYADNPYALYTVFDTIFSDILDKVGSASAASSNSTSLVSGSVVYQARFSSASWYGELVSRNVSSTGELEATENWNAAAELNGKAPNDRTILTVSRDTGDGIPFRWASISGMSDTTQKDFLNRNAHGEVDGKGELRVQFLRGDDVPGFRVRYGVLGDIVHSTPVYVGAPQAGYLDSSYTSFVEDYVTRSPMVYVGANDGMLHGFDAETGEEKIAFVPGEIYVNLSALTDAGYGSTSGASAVPHKYYVDGSPMVSDAKVGSEWRTVLAGGLNGGGQGVYALDITDPSTFSETNAHQLVLWEFTDEDDRDLGFTYIQPTVDKLTNESAQIAKLNNGKWAVILGNGYNNTDPDGHASSTGNASLFILFLDGGIDGDWSDPGDYIKIDTGEGSTSTPNGLATPLPVDTDGDGDVDLVYAGDLLGNLWKFDLTDSSPSSWTKAKLFTAKDGDGVRQPITTAPLVTPHPRGGFMVGVGTGKYLEQSDITDNSVQTLYGIWDNREDGSVTIVSGRSELVEQKILGEVAISSGSYRVTTNQTVDYETYRGWYMDLPPGERVAYNPLLQEGRFVFVTLLPDNTDPCSAGGSGWLMELEYLNGSRVTDPPFDITGDLVINESDKVNFDLDNDGINEKISPSGKRSSVGIPSTPAVLEVDSRREVKIIQGSTGQAESIWESKSVRRGRLSWREIVQD